MGLIIFIKFHETLDLIVSWHKWVSIPFGWKSLDRPLFPEFSGKADPSFYGMELQETLYTRYLQWDVTLI